MKKTYIVIATMIAMPAWSNNCVMQERTVAQSNVKILERSTVRRDVVPAPTGRRCIVDFRVRVGNEWHTAFGEHTWSGDRPSDEACLVAVKKAEDAVRERVGQSSSMSERILICKDRPELETLQQSQIGTVGNIAQFRIHPNYPHRFYHNGTQCRWFVEPTFNGRDIQNFQGVACEVRDHKWVVVDKF